ncbi:16S ribosomal RNA methyltransferase RsmE [Metamycoplasma arthritidis]|uniref:Ribosomal RNA small subunit methyltransferase E n=1 Tax=Metamycoplasma arthritidis (strain 158L3-1) TaxID=243272 RepID=B3PMK2_META1|nr:16S rRNA (uracil(1498)-N(3))-methyltransferase [Metamycoplasma arthritidis]ACF07254.1 conserved hypothetical protein [Metamycoplasma arthritidis 158L3-1]VEU78777.1 16S ribosomal RNA methyltransferase RsmE [Metamycoplasma arthritidis]
MYKFFCYHKAGDAFILDDETCQHFRAVRIKDEHFLINFENEFYECSFKGPNLAIIIKKLTINNELPFKLIVAIPLIKQANFEMALQKSVELGASEIIPFYSDYCDVANKNITNKISRYLKIIKQAAQQSFRNIIPKLHTVHSFSEILTFECKNKYLAYENEKSSPFKPDFAEAMLIVGPEGGFNFNEIAQAKQKNVKIVSLTKSILRTETAIIYMLSKLV